MKQIIIILLLLLDAYGLSGQDITLSVDAPAVVVIGEQFRLSWTANSRGGEFEAPEIKDFFVLSGPQTSFSQSTQIINGRVTSTISNTYTYYLQANKEGKFTIPPARYRLKNEEYLSGSKEIEVVSEGQALRQDDRDTTEESLTGQSASTADLYARLLLNKRELYLGEHLVASLKIYSRVNISGIQEVKYPDFQGFLKEDLETPPLRNLERENVSGSIYGTGVLQRFLLYPQRTGTISIDPASLTVLLQQQSLSNDPFFGDFFSTFTTIPKMIATLPLEIKVKTLPEGAPPGFEGAVGNFSVRSELSADTVSVNNALSFKITLEGQGNLKLTAAPDLNLPPDIEIYEPKVSSNLTASVSGTSGSRVFEYVLIPRYHGEFTIPPIQFSYFDPSMAQYRTLRTEEYKFTAMQVEEGEEGARVYGGVSKENVKYLGRDIRYIKTGKANFRSGKNLLLKNNLFLYSYPGTLLLFIILIVVRREQIKRNSDIARVRNRKAAGLAARRLKQAAECLKNSDTEGFYSELLKALWGYLSDKYNIPLSELNIDAVNHTMSKNKLDSETVADLQEVISKCEYSKYSPDSDISTADEVYRKAEKIIKDIENK
ncbi:MAG: BatD family protein [Bacteroidales bacterium]|nr:BatD family protein [Bacteroidales bacterium]